MNWSYSLGSLSFWLSYRQESRDGLEHTWAFQINRWKAPISYKNDGAYHLGIEKKKKSNSFSVPFTRRHGNQPTTFKLPYFTILMEGCNFSFYLKGVRALYLPTTPQNAFPNVPPSWLCMSSSIRSALCIAIVHGNARSDILNIVHTMKNYSQ